MSATSQARSDDFLRIANQFKLGALTTEASHPVTAALSETAAQDTAAALRMLFDVDDDVVRAYRAFVESGRAAGIADEVAGRLRRGGRIFFTGCGSTGRLSIQLVSIWRDFWQRQRARGLTCEPPAADWEDRAFSVMAGGDFALIKAVEGFEDFTAFGKKQIGDLGVDARDVVFAITEGGETSFVIGTAWKGVEAGARVYFVYNNPDDRLMPFDRSRSVLTEPGITKINLTTGPQAITGSTRMQATTIETYVVAAIVETAVARVLAPALGGRDMERLGFPPADGAGGTGAGVAARLREFEGVLAGVRAALPEMAGLTDIEAAAYAGGRFSTYYAERGLITVFIDSTERSPTFRLFPLDTVKEPRRKCWIQVWTDAKTPEEAWGAFLGRPFRGLAAEKYRQPFETEVGDPYLRRAALESLKKAGDDQAGLYDFSLSKGNTEGRGPKKGDLAVLVALTPEVGAFADGRSAFARVLKLAASGGADAGVLVVSDTPAKEFAAIADKVRRLWGGAAGRLVVVPVPVRAGGDAFGLRQQMAAKMLLNAHSTAVMAKLGKVIGNTMTNVSPSNLKLIGRATFLIQSHVNDVLGTPEWVKAQGASAPITYGEANAVLYDSIAYLKDRQAEAGQTAEVAFSIIRILESLKRRTGLSHAETLELVKAPGLSAYLARIR